MENSTPPIFQTFGSCPICNNNVDFIATNTWFRDSLVCTRCGSIPRERAIMTAIELYFPNWRNSVVHESSSGNRGASLKISKECNQYIASQYFKNEDPGSVISGFRCENLESLSFDDCSIDLHITQDVFEHIFHPRKAFREIARTLKPGGMHICTVPLVNKNNPSKLRAQIQGGGIVHLQPAQYHENPVEDGKSLVTVDWGFDICRHIFEASGLFTHTLYIDDLEKGIRAEYIEVLVTIKPAISSEGNEIP